MTQGSPPQAVGGVGPVSTGRIIRRETAWPCSAFSGLAGQPVGIGPRRPAPHQHQGRQASRPALLTWISMLSCPLSVCILVLMKHSLTQLLFKIAILYFYFTLQIVLIHTVCRVCVYACVRQGQFDCQWFLLFYLQGFEGSNEVINYQSIKPAVW